MVLSRRRRFWEGLFGGLLASAAAGVGHAATLEKFIVRRADCPVRVRPRAGGAWAKYTGNVPQGITVRGTRMRKNPQIVMFRLEGSHDVFAAAHRCMFADDAPAGALVSEAPEPPSASDWSFSLGAVSWQEQFNLKNSLTSVTYSLRSNVIGACPGYSYLQRTRQFEWGSVGCLIYAKAQISPSADASTSPIIYAVRNVNVFSGLLGLTGLWRPRDSGAAFGLHIPVMVRYASWPEPHNYTVGRKFALLPGGLVEARIDRGNWSLSQRVGVVGGLSNFLWWFAINKSFR
jgi:hypothetical protein